jgi:hypothetical protein
MNLMAEDDGVHVKHNQRYIDLPVILLNSHW